MVFVFFWRLFWGDDTNFQQGQISLTTIKVGLFIRSGRCPLTACFDAGLKPELLDKASFKFGHRLLDHPALSLESLSKVIPALPKQQVMYSKGLLSVEADFEGTFKKRPEDMSVAEVIEQIRERDSYIMVSQPEVDEAFKDLYAALLSEVAGALKKKGIAGQVLEPMLYLFIASPNSVTPFHIDRYSTLLMQFRGSKTVCVHPQWEPRVVSTENMEAYATYNRTKLPWSPEVDQLGTHWHFSPGEAVHIPFMAGHHVKNGPNDVSISMSIIFNTEESMVWRRALRFNYAARRRLNKIGITPSPVGENFVRDWLKSGVIRLMDRSAS
ncbi:Hypothetical protein HDN1F_12040 [gamma proteobacterium HdN1]|nr:Hypothetical protein HDN1F_12040 [gamma proteobacterium HdN1]